MAACELRPSGIAIIDDERIDVVTRGEFVEPGSRIRVIAEEGNVVRVAEIKEAEDDRMRKDRTSR
ncbi:MAG: hypothetical protein BWZ10_03249 [candidate division BRC1 bacterium ADurb.BinA364]|nr:MAG: hypothetical protein BWZ10_03249 [candidate division BRC1 bacterium ADurb.BinA364]